MVKSHNGVKGTELFACGSSGRNLKNFSRFAGKNPCWGPLIVTLQAVVACYKITRSTLSKKGTPTQARSVNFEKKNKNKAINRSTRVPLK